MDIIYKYNPLTLINNSARGFAEEVLLSMYILLVVAVFYRSIYLLIDRFVPTEDTAQVYRRRKLGRTAFLLLALVLLLPQFFSRIEYLPTLLGFTGAGLIISMKEFIQNFAGWFLIMGSNGFSVGDRIEIDKVKGDVINIGLMRFTLLELDQENHADQSTNRIIHLPNNLVVSSKVFVVSQKMDFVWDEMKIYITVDSDWEKAEKICYEILNNESVLDAKLIEKKTRELSKNYLVRIGKTTPIVYTIVEEGKIILSLRYLTPIREKRSHRSSISREVLKSFAGLHSISFYES